MENAVEFLKTFFAVTVFALALTVLFRMTALAKDTADLVFMAIDETTFINYDADANEPNRIVTFQEIMPTIYRYAQEGYGVTIVENGKIVARFDLDTESQVSSCFWDESNPHGSYARASVEAKDKSDKIKQEMVEYINKYIALDGYGISEIDDVGSLNTLIKNIYGTGDATNPVYTGWLKSNTYNNNYITQRINCDMYGTFANICDSRGVTNFSLINPGVNEQVTARIDGKHEAVKQQGLFNYFQGATESFKEYIVQIDNNEYIADEDNQNTGLLVFGTLRNTKKREIIYVNNY